MVAPRQPTNDRGARTRDRLAAPAPARAHRLFGVALGAVSLTTGTPSTGQTSTAQASTSPSLASLPGLVPRIAIAYDVGGRGSAGLNELAWEGVKRAAGQFDAEIKEITAEPDDTDADREERLTELAEDHYYPIFAIGPSWAAAVAKVAPKYPRTWFGIVDDGSVNAPKVIGIQFNEEQGSFLVGAAAALTSKTGNVGFVGAVQSPLLEKYEAGFTAGARAADPDVKVQVAYLSQPPASAGSATRPRPGRPRWTCTTRAPM